MNETTKPVTNGELAAALATKIMNDWHAEKQGLPLPLALAKLGNRMASEIEKAMDAREKESQEKFAACEEAVAYVLARIREESTVRDVLGFGTESFTRLTKAAAVLWNLPHAEVCEKFLPGSAGLHAES